MKCQSLAVDYRTMKTMIRERLGRLVISIACVIAIAAIVDCNPKTEAERWPSHKMGNVVVPGPDFTLGQGDRNVPFAIPVLDSNGQPVNLIGATVAFRYRTQTQADAGVSGTGKVTGTAPGKATYVFTAADTATPGTYNAEFQITLALPDGGTDGSAETFSYPLSKFLRIAVRAGP